MKTISRKTVLFIFAMALVTFQFLSLDALAYPTKYENDCGGCHSAATEPTCIGCHKHGLGDFSGATTQSTYLPGETVSVDLTGGNRGGWVRAAIYDQNGNQVAISNGNESGKGRSITLPGTLSAPAPTEPGSYTWQAS